MPLQASGTIKFSEIQTEFGGTNPISLSEYVRGGGLVPDETVNNAIPTSNSNIQLSDFYSTSVWATDKTETITSSNSSWTPAYSGWSSATVYVIGGGGGGSGTNDDDASAATGGTAGGTAIRAYTTLPGANVTVGAAGGVQAPSGGYNGDYKAGYAGGSSTFVPSVGSSDTTTLTGGGGNGGGAGHGGSQGYTQPANAGGSASGGSTNYSGQTAGSVPGPNSTTVSGPGTSVSLTSQLGTLSYPNQGEHTVAAPPVAAPEPTKPAHWSSATPNITVSFKGGQGNGSEGGGTINSGIGTYGAGGGACSWSVNGSYYDAKRPGVGKKGVVIVVYE